MVRSKQVRAHGLVHRAIRTGQIPHPSTLSCVDCGEPATCYDHRRYDEPLAVEPVCTRDNQRRGKAVDWSGGDITIRGLRRETREQLSQIAERHYISSNSLILQVLDAFLAEQHDEKSLSAWTFNSKRAAK